MFFKTTPDTLDFKNSQIKRAFVAGFFSGISVMFFAHFLIQVLG